MILYKYRDLIKEDKTTIEEKIDRICQIINFKKFWCGSVNRFEDKQEFKAEIKFDESPDAIKETCLLFSEIKAGSGRCLMPYQYEQYIKATDFASELKEVIFNMQDSMREKIGVCCFSELGNDRRLWEKYGGNYNGVCIEIEVPKESQECIHEINYKENSVITLIDMILSCLGKSKEGKQLNLLEVMTCNKTKEWEFEKEWRFLSKKARLICAFPEISIKEILFGNLVDHEIKENIKQRINDTCEKENIKISSLIK